MTTLAAADKLIDQWESGGYAEPVKTAPKGSTLSAADSLIQDWESGKDVPRETAQPRVSPNPARPASASDLTAVYLNKGAAQFGQMSDTAADTQRKADIPIAEMMQKLIGDPARKAALDGAKEAPDIRQEIARRYPRTNPEVVQAEMNKAFAGYQMAARTLANEHEFRGVDARKTNARFLARNTTPDMVPYVAHALNELYAEKGPNQNRKLSGQVWDTLAGALQEMKNLPQDIVHIATDEEGVAQRTQQYLAAMEGADPVAGKDSGALRKGLLGAVGMVPMAVGAEAAGGLAAAKVGRYGLAGRAAGSGTVAALWSAPSVKQAYEQMVASGVSEGKAKTGSLVSGTIQAAIETLAIDAVLPTPLRGIVKGKLGGVLAKGLTNRFVALGKEIFEEGAQGFTQQLATEIQDDVDATTMDAFKRSTKAAIDSAKAAIIPILFLGAPGTVATFKNAKADTELNEFRKWMAGQQETAGYIVQANPELAAKILGAENPTSRAAIKGASPALAESLDDKASREAFVANLAKTPEGKVASIEAEYARKFKNPKTRERRLEADPAYKQAQQDLSDYYAKLHEARQEFGGDVAASQETAKIKAVKEKFTQAGGPKWSPRPGEDVGVKIDTGLVKEAANAQEGGSQTQEAGKETGVVQGAGGGVRVRNNVQDGAQAQAQALQAVGAGIGRPELANPAVAPEARQLVNVVDEQRKQAGIPEVRHDAEVFAEAQARLAQDYSGERQRLLNTARDGGQLGDTDTVVAQAILDREALAAVSSGDKQATRDAVHLIDAYRRTGTEQGRAFRQRRDKVETPEQRMRHYLGEALLTPPKKVQKKLRNAKTKKAKNAILDSWGDDVEGLKRLLDAEGIDLNDMAGLLADPIKTHSALRAISAAKSDRWDAVYEFWVNGILSAPTTNAANIAGNIGHASWHFTAERLAESAVNVFVRDKSAASFGEFRYILGGIWPGIVRGAQNLVRSWETESPYFDVSLGREGEKKIEGPHVAIPGKFGRVVRAFGYRPLLAMDEFSKSIIAQMEVGAAAYRIAKSEGLKGAEMQNRIHGLVADTTSDAWTESIRLAHELTFQQPSTPAVNEMVRVRGLLPGTRYIVPFIKTPMNIVKTGMKKSPLGIIPLAYRVARASQTGDWTGITRGVAQQMLAWAGVLAIAGWNDPEDPWLTGSADYIGYGPSMTARRPGTPPPMSVKLGNTWVSYSRLEPFATALATTVDWTNAFKSGNMEKISKTPLTSILGTITEKTFMQGIGDMFEALNQAGSGAPDKLSRWASSFAASWVPNVVRSTSRGVREVYPERGVWGKGEDWWLRIARRTAQKTELRIVRDTPAYDLWGRPARTSPGKRPATEMVWRILIPSRIKSAEPFIGDRVLVNWNTQHPGEEKNPFPPVKRYKKKGVTYYMSDAEYAEFSRVAGERTRQIIERMSGQFNAETPTENDIKRIASAIRNGRAFARSQLFNGATGDDD